VTYFANEQTLRSAASGDVAASLGASAGSLVVAFLNWLIQGLAELALTFHSLAALRNEDMQPRESISAAAGRFGSWLGMSLLRGLAYLALLLALVLPSVLLAFAADNFDRESTTAAFVVLGITCLLLLAMLVIMILVFILQTRWVVSTPSLVIEQLRARQSLRRSWRLTRGKFWRSFGVMFVLGVIALIVLSLPNFAIQMVAMFGTERTALWSAAGSAFGTILSSLYVPLSAAAFVVLYYDLRVRRENLDLDVRVRQLEAEMVSSEEAQP
jgi:membrane-anchored glycerophosphoryl diester phosphodiesterase (GDPDase)